MKPHFPGNICLLMGRSKKLPYFALVTHPAMLSLLNCLHLNPRVFLPFTFLILSLSHWEEVSSWLGVSLPPGINPPLCPIANGWISDQSVLTQIRLSCSWKSPNVSGTLFAWRATEEKQQLDFCLWQQDTLTPSSSDCKSLRAYLCSDCSRASKCSQPARWIHTVKVSPRAPLGKNLSQIV